MSPCDNGLAIRSLTIRDTLPFGGSNGNRTRNSAVTGQHYQPFNYGALLEQIAEIEPATCAWQAHVLPLNYICLCMARVEGFEPSQLGF